MSSPPKGEGRCGLRVIGVGNPLIGDDGAGVRVVERLRGRVPDGVELIDGGTEGLGLICWFEGVDRVVLVDAVRMGSAPGTVAVLDPARLRSLRRGGGRVSSHWTDVLEVIAAAARLGFEPRLDIVGIEPQSLDVGTGLSEAAARGVEVATRTVMELIKGAGAGTAAPVE